MFGQRVRDYQPAMLDELLASGEVLWSGAGAALRSGDGWVAFHTADTAPLTLAAADRHRDHRDPPRAYSTRSTAAARTSSVSSPPTASATDALKEALWQLIWSGRVTGDTFAPVRALLAGDRRGGTRRPATPAHRHRTGPAAESLQRRASAARRQPPIPTVAGRWSALPAAEPDSTVRAAFQADLLLGRYGVLTRGAVGRRERARRVRDALQGAVRPRGGRPVPTWLLRRIARRRAVRDRHHRRPAADVRRQHRRATRDQSAAVVLAATDPANPYGAALPWPDPPTPMPRTARAARPARSWCSSAANWPGS